MKWLEDLKAYYGTTQTNRARVEFLLQHYGEEPAAVMDRAVESYKQAEIWFPFVANLRPHVEAARIWWNGGKPAPSSLTDEQRLRIEQGLGDIRSDEEIAAELAEHRARLPELMGNVSR